MYNSNIPTQAELPTSGQLLRSTVIAAATAVLLLVTTVLPAEYGIDPIGAGRVLGLTQMGEIKKSLADEAEAEVRAANPGAAPAAPAAPSEKRSDASDTLLSRLAGLVISPAAAATTAPAAPAQAAKSDEVTVTLRPNEGTEIKVEMRQGATVSYNWTAEGGVVNFDAHGEPYNAPNKTHSYKKGRGAASDEGVIQAAFDGNHGWFWRNRGSEPVTIKLRASGDYQNLKHMK